MPLPLAPLLPIALRLGLAATASYGLTRWLQARSFPGRTDQRVEDVLDDLGEGLSAHRPQDRAEEGVSQTNSTARVRRAIQIGGRRFEVDAALIARFRVRTSG
jgi:hypothetical protein